MSDKTIAGCDPSVSCHEDKRQWTDRINIQAWEKYLGESVSAYIFFTGK